MLIIGTGGMAREVAGIIEYDHPYNQLYFFNNIDKDTHLLWDKYPIYHSEEEILTHFKTNGNQFISCIANPLIRQRITEKIEQMGGVPGNAISYRSDISHFATFSTGIVVQPACVVASDVEIKKGVFLNAHAIVGHDSIIGEYASLGPGCRILGGVQIGSHSYIGCNSVIMPGVKIGSKVRIGVGKIIDQDIPDNSKII
mgnify:CR=1 FL=1